MEKKTFTTEQKNLIRFMAIIIPLIIFMINTSLIGTILTLFGLSVTLLVTIVECIFYDETDDLE